MAMASRLDMRREPPKCFQLLVGQFFRRMLAHRVVAGRRVVAPLARLLVYGMNKRPVHDQLTQVGENRCGLGKRWRGNAHALALPLMTREVVLGATHLRVLVSRPQ